MPRIIEVSNKKVDAVDLRPVAKYMEINPKHNEYLLADAGQEPYKLYGFLSQQLEGDLIDVGTQFGLSALALSINDKNNVLTFDIEKQIPEPYPKLTPLNRSNIKMYVCHGQAVIPRIAKADLILLDINPHDGDTETKFVESLIQHGFRGILVADDIELNDGMQRFWHNLPSHLKRFNVTHMGHWSGTGIIVFDPSYIDVHVLDV